jgi:hypothetical protein
VLDAARHHRKVKSQPPTALGLVSSVSSVSPTVNLPTHPDRITPPNSTHPYLTERDRPLRTPPCGPLCRALSGRLSIFIGCYRLQDQESPIWRSLVSLFTRCLQRLRRPLLVRIAIPCSCFTAHSPSFQHYVFALPSFHLLRWGCFALLAIQLLLPCLTRPFLLLFFLLLIQNTKSPNDLRYPLLPTLQQTT